MYKEKGIHYTSNYMMANVAGILPINTIHGIMEIPIYYIDWSHLMGKKFYKKFSLEVLKLKTPGLKVFDFHPFHIFLNSSTDNSFNTPSYRILHLFAKISLLLL